MKKARVIPHTSWAAKSLWSVEGKTMSMLLFALAILGIGDGLIVLANLGSSPWTVLSQGVALQAQFTPVLSVKIGYQGAYNHDTKANNVNAELRFSF